MNTKGCKFVLGIILSHLLWISASAQVSFGHPEKINRQWKFTLSDPQEAVSYTHLTLPTTSRV